MNNCARYDMCGLYVLREELIEKRMKRGTVDGRALAVYVQWMCFASFLHDIYRSYYGNNTRGVYLYNHTVGHE